jgi:hypothetical protein
MIGYVWIGAGGAHGSMAGYRRLFVVDNRPKVPIVRALVAMESALNRPRG